MNLFNLLLISITILNPVICEIIGIENHHGLKIISLTNSSLNKKTMRCVVCSSLKIKDINSKILTNAQKKINAVGDECINNPMKFVKDCDEIKKLFDNSNKEYNGCYNMGTQMEYLDEDGIMKQEFRVSRFCGYSGKLGCEKNIGFGSQRYVCFCDKPECNSTNKLSPHLFTFFIIFTLKNVFYILKN